MPARSVAIAVPMITSRTVAKNISRLAPLPTTRNIGRMTIRPMTNITAIASAAWPRAVASANPIEPVVLPGEGLEQDRQYGQILEQEHREARLPSRRAQAPVRGKELHDDCGR